MAIFQILKRVSYPRILFTSLGWQPMNYSLSQRTLNYSHELREVILTDFALPKDTLVYFMSSGRSAIRLVLRALVKKNLVPEKNEVILPSYACTGILQPILDEGLVPVFVDINTSLLPSTRDILRKINKNTLACFIHNLCGHDAFEERIYQASLENKAFLIDDHCQSLYLPKKSRPNIITILSFCFGKTLSATCGGAIISNCLKKNLEDEYLGLPVESLQSSILRQRLYYRSYYSLSSKIRNRLSGLAVSPKIPRSHYELHQMNSVDIAMILSQWEFKKNSMKKQKENYEIFKKQILKKTLAVLPQTTHSYEALPLIFGSAEDKEDFVRHFFSHNIEIMEMYRPLHMRFEEFKNIELPQTTMLYNRIVAFPIRADLTACEKNRILTTINTYRIAA